MQDCVIFDIDGTLANSSHRAHLQPGPFAELDGSEPWTTYLNACGDDSVYAEIAALARCLATQYPIIICTCRSENQRTVTAAWLSEHKIPYSTMMMSRPGDLRPDPEIKEEMLDEIRMVFNPLFSVEDRLSNARMYRRNGVRCLHVIDGD